MWRLLWNVSVGVALTQFSSSIVRTQPLNYVHRTGRTGISICTPSDITGYVLG